MRRRLAIVAFIAAAAMALLPHPERKASGTAKSEFPGWPETFDGRPLVETPLTKDEAVFDAQFPGRIGRFRSGDDIVILRWTDRATHRAHPLSVCLRAGGWSVEPLPVVRRDDGDWSSFGARRGDAMLIVRERVIAADGTVFADVQEWFWKAIAGRTAGPWLVVSVASSRTGLTLGPPKIVE